MKFISLCLLFLFSCGLITTKSPEHVKADQFYNLGNDKVLEKDYDMALDLFAKASSLRPDDHKILHNIGMVHYFKKEPKKAIDFLKKALTKNAENSESLSNLASIYFGQEDFQNAKKYYLDFIKNSKVKNDYQANFNLAFIYLKEDNKIKARKHLLAIADGKENSCILHMRIGKIELELKNYPSSLKHFNTSLNPPCYLSPESLYLKGMVLERLGQYKNARDSYNDLVAKFPTTFFSSFALGRLAMIKGRKDRIKL